MFTLCKCDMILAGSFVLIYKGTFAEFGEMGIRFREIRSEREVKIPLVPDNV